MDTLSRCEEVVVDLLHRACRTLSSPATFSGPLATAGTIPITSSRPLDSQNPIRAQKRSRHHSRRGALLACHRQCCWNLSTRFPPSDVHRPVRLSQHTPCRSKHTTSSGTRVLSLSWTLHADHFIVVGPRKGILLEFRRLGMHV